jgi:hypothetical protein
MENRFGGMILVEMVEVVGCIDGFAREAIALNIPLHTVQSLPSDLTLYSRANVIIHQYTSPCSPTESCPLKSSSGSAPAANHQLALFLILPVYLCVERHTISWTSLFLLNSSLAKRNVSSRVLGSEIRRVPRTMVRHRESALPLCRNCNGLKSANFPRAMALGIFGVNGDEHGLEKSCCPANLGVS